MTREERIEEWKRFFVMATNVQRGNIEMAEKLRANGTQQAWANRLDREAKKMQKFIQQLRMQLTNAGLDPDSLLDNQPSKNES